jgi:hypothetical protein
MDPQFKINDWVVCTRQKHGMSPGPRAKNITPSPHGDLYSYEVDKYWIVRDVLPETLLVETRTGKVREIPKNDRRLRHPSWWERLFYADRFPARSKRPASTLSEPQRTSDAGQRTSDSVQRTNDAVQRTNDPVASAILPPGLNSSPVGKSA